MNDKFYERNAELLKAHKAGDPAARELLIVENARLVSSIAGRYTFNNKYEFDDLRQEGYIGLIKAIDKFDPSHEVTFAHYASYWIKQSILRYIYNRGRVIRLPVYLHEKIFILKKAIEALTAKNEREPTTFELSKYLKMNIFEVEKLLRLKEDVESLDEPIKDEDGGYTRLDTTQDEQESPADIAEKNDRIRQVNKAVMQLNERQREVIRRRYAFKCKAETLDSIGNDIGVSRTRVQQIEKAALKKLRALPELQIYRIEKKVDDRTDFYKKTEQVVMWREEERQKLYKWKLESLHTMTSV
jgi:RNA polymerase sigma factor (sigma-70 family)